ncbi:junctophilin-1-like [Symsagittifera roscoffensis]|uniref:junctophilin-1-like n=1 Tax=Symsagittifera roscoffensis TaxID=84072 RepID=UPI00307BC578
MSQYFPNSVGVPQSTAGGGIPNPPSIQPPPPSASQLYSKRPNYNSPPTGGFYEFEDGGHYIGCWEDGKAHGFGICTGPKGQGEYAGSFDKGFEVSGVYRWPTGSKYSGQWQNGLRHGLGVERKGSWVYRGEWNKGLKGRYGLRESNCSCAKYEGTWAQNLQDGYGIETYADSGKYTGQWVAGMRNGLGVRTSVPYGMASIVGAPQHRRASLASLTEDQMSAAETEGGNKLPSSGSSTGIPENFGVRGGFVLNENYVPTDDNISAMSSTFKKISLSRSTLLEGLRIRVRRKRDGSTNSLRSDSTTMSSGGGTTVAPDTLSMVTTNGTLDMMYEDVPHDCTEIYMGEWQRDKRTGCGISERTDGLRYEGYWLNNKRHGFGCFFLKDGRKVEGKWRSNKLVTPVDRKKGGRNILQHGTAKRIEKVERALIDAKHAAELAKKKAEITLSRVNTAQLKAEQANQCADLAHQDAEYARVRAKEFAELSHRKPPPDETFRRRQSSTPSPRHSVKKLPSDGSSTWVEEGSQKDFLSVPSEGTASFKSNSDQDITSALVMGRADSRSGSKERLDILGQRVKTKFNRLSRSFRMRRSRERVDGAHPGESPKLNGSLGGSSHSVRSGRERSGSMPCNANAQLALKAGGSSSEHYRSREGPSWEIPNDFLPSPIVEITSPEPSSGSPFSFGEKEASPVKLPSVAQKISQVITNNVLTPSMASDLATTNNPMTSFAQKLGLPSASYIYRGISAYASSAAGSAGDSSLQHPSVAGAAAGQNQTGSTADRSRDGPAAGFYPYLPPALQPFSSTEGASQSSGGAGIVGGGGGLVGGLSGVLDPGSGGVGEGLMAFSSSPNNPSSSNQNSALQQDRSWFQSGEMVVFVLILNLGFTALFAHLLTS